MAPMVGELVFIDTNVLLTATDESRPNHDVAGSLIANCGSRGLHLVASGQVLREYLVVATRPVDANGLGLSTQDAVGNLGAFLAHIRILAETEKSAEHLRQLGLAHQLRGKSFHDANIVATMSSHGIHILVTENIKDFASFGEVDAVSVLDFAEGASKVLHNV